MHFLSWFVRIGFVYDSAKNKRSGHTKSVGRIGSKYCISFFKRVYDTYRHCIFNICTAGILFNASMAVWFLLSYRIELACVYFGNSYLNNYCMVNCWLQSNKSSYSKPCQEPENGVKQFENLVISCLSADRENLKMMDSL